MKLTKDSIWILIIGIVITLISFGSIAYGFGLWYLPGVIGVWLIFDYISSIKNNDTAIQIFKQKT